VSGEIDPSELRVSDLDRERAAELLAAAMEQGRITPVEFGDRCAAVWAARTRAQLLAVLSDLPGGPPPELAPLVLDVPFGQVRRSGAWAVPELVRVRGTGQRTTLDFTSALIRGPTVVIEVSAAMSVTRVLLPPDVLVDADGLELVVGSVRHRGPRGAVEAARDLGPRPARGRSRGVGGINGPGWARREVAGPSIPPRSGLRRLLPGGGRAPVGPPIRFVLRGRATLCSVTLYYQRPTRRR
jgi:hypothetical protein